MRTTIISLFIAAAIFGATPGFAASIDNQEFCRINSIDQPNPEKWFGECMAYLHYIDSQEPDAPGTRSSPSEHSLKDNASPH